MVLVDPSERDLAWCLDGRHACPPEDVGGTSGYECFLESIADSSQEDHSAMLQWG